MKDVKITLRVVDDNNDNDDDDDDDYDQRYRKKFTRQSGWRMVSKVRLTSSTELI